MDSSTYAGVSNSFSDVIRIYIPGFYTGQTLLKKNLSTEDCISLVPKLFVFRHRKPVDQILRYTSHANLFLLMASCIIWRSPLLRATISKNRVMLLDMVQPVMLPATCSSCRPLPQDSIFSIFKENLY